MTAVGKVLGTDLAEASTPSGQNRVAVDWDGTCVESVWPRRDGEWIDGAVWFMKAARNLGVEVVIHSTRFARYEVDERTPYDGHADELHAVRDKLDSAGLHDVKLWLHDWKPGALMYLDDKTFPAFDAHEVENWWDALDELKRRLNRGITAGPQPDLAEVEERWLTEPIPIIRDRDPDDEHIEKVVRLAAADGAPFSQSVVRELDGLVFSSDSAERKAIPVTTGVLDYFSGAIAEVAKVSKAGNDKHNPGEALHWARGKSTDQADAIGRHLIDRGKIDPETGQRHSAELAWRALALLQEELEEEGLVPRSRASR